jgi:hypothetical protein
MAARSAWARNSPASATSGSSPTGPDSPGTSPTAAWCPTPARAAGCCRGSSARTARCAQEAHAIGYAAELVEPEALAATALAEARRYLNSSPFSIRHIKSLVYRGLERDLGEHMAVHVETMSAAFKSADHKEGVASFLERRPAKFVGH